jgi:hypothetical protein
MVALAVILANLAKELLTALLAKRNGKSGGNPGNPHNGVSKAEAHARDKTRERIGQIHAWADDERTDRREQSRLLAELVTLTKAQKESLERIERRQEDAARRSRGPISQ